MTPGRKIGRASDEEVDRNLWRDRVPGAEDSDLAASCMVQRARPALQCSYPQQVVLTVLLCAVQPPFVRDHELPGAVGAYLRWSLRPGGRIPRERGTTGDLVDSVQALPLAQHNRKS